VSVSLPWIVAALVAVNLWTFLAFRQDKQRARVGAWRISEGDLLFLAAAGGWPAALVARHLFRHKTRKEPFSMQLQLIATLEGGAGIGLAFVYG
jgi:uncharacterized membrane protein YsdA (DUF1294 family)